MAENTFLEFDADRRIWWGEDGNNVPRVKRFLSEVKQGIVPRTLWVHEDAGHTQEAKQELVNSVDFEFSDNVLDSVKPTRLIRRMLHIATTPESGDIVLDFFAGSGTTGHAVIEQNQSDGGNRRFILVQLPEPLPTPEKKLKTIADLCKKRIRHVGDKLADDDAGKLDLDGGTKPDRGFRVFKLDQSNFTTWDAGIKHDPDVLERQLEFHIEHIRDGRTDDDILYEILLKSWPSALTVPVEKQTLAGKTVYSVAAGLFIICLERRLTLDLVRAIADLKPERVVCLDEGFAGNDQLKANAVQIFKTKGVTSFKTV